MLNNPIVNKKKPSVFQVFNRFISCIVSQAELTKMPVGLCSYEEKGCKFDSKYNDCMDWKEISLILDECCHLTTRLPLLVGVSGGPDSLTLLDLLLNSGYSVIVAHLDHALRPNSALEAEQVIHFARQRGLKTVFARKDVRQYASLGRMTIEEAAREVRYQFLFEQARAFSAQAVAVAHTADDQVETILMHLIRGSGLSGLRGMPFISKHHPWDDHIPLVRPLLRMWRSEVLIYCQEHGLDPVFDASNLDSTYFRNRLRNELLPQLETYNPNIKQVLLRMSQTVSGDFEILQDAVDSAWESVFQMQADDILEFSLEEMHRLGQGLQRRILRRAVEILQPGNRDLDFDTIERAVDFLESPSRSKRMQWMGNLWLKMEMGKLVVGNISGYVYSEEKPQLFFEQEITLDLQDRQSLGRGWYIESRLVPIEIYQEERWDVEDPFQAGLALEKVTLPLQVRSRQPGDRLRPLGMQGHSMKLSDFFINRKLPQELRDRWPLVVAGAQIAWIPGYQLMHPFRITNDTQFVIHLSMVQSHSE
jgi:tRNA(Ile)-lysidine synthase